MTTEVIMELYLPDQLKINFETPLALIKAMTKPHVGKNSKTKIK